MNKEELVNSIVELVGSKSKSEKVLNKILDSIVDTVVKGEKVQLVGFGSFEAKDRGERTARNPQTGEQVKIPARKVPVFKAGKAFKDKVIDKK